MHCCPRPKAEGNSASGHPQHRGGDSFDCCTERYEIVVLLPNSEDTCYLTENVRRNAIKYLIGRNIRKLNCF